MKRRGKIVATVGPASQEKKTLKDLVLAGVNVFRLNFSHGNLNDFEKIINNIREIETQIGQSIGILGDLQGPRIRTGNLGKNGITLQPGQKIIITTKTTSNEGEIPIDFPDLPKVLKPHSRILLDNGELEIGVDKIDKEKIHGTVLLGGKLSSNKGINLPGTRIGIPAFTQKDRTDLAFGIKHTLDFIAVSFVHTAKDITQVRDAIIDIDPKQKNTPIIAKLERPEALSNLDKIIDCADGVMVARGDLGVEISPQTVPIAQKRIIEAANRCGKIVITATQMLESMIHHPQPSRAEAADVANAIFDGTDALMLSGETAIGNYPVRVVETMDAIIQKSEENLKYWGRWQGTPHEITADDATSIAMAARELANDRSVAAIVVFTETGRTARLMSKAAPNAPIIGFTPNERTYRRMTLYRGVFPHRIPSANSMEEMLRNVNMATKESTFIQTGQQVVVITGFPVGEKRPPSLALLHTLSD
ncbi:MAG: pyruvate kinase [Anaerolineales bacterium]|jgi:pyruvate kinase